MFPETCEPEDLACIVRQCPSGALQFKSKTASLHDETAPPVDILRVRENGPLGLLADLKIDGADAGFRATLCRCGQSKNKPYCDTSHLAVNFKASGEPDTIDNTELTSRGGALHVDRLPDGPLSISGNIEICAGTGRVVLRTDNVRLCRCGNSQSKPVCDGSHIAAGFKDRVQPKERPTLSPDTH
ncbi:Iron-binding zinc finger CDGSH type [compost metagenome]